MSHASQPSAPAVLGPQAQYQAYLAEGRFMLQFSPSTGQYVFYPRVAVPGSGAADLQWRPACGLGTLYAITVNHTRQGSHNIALVDLDEGPRMMTCLIGCLSAPIGTRVRARVSELNGEPAVVFQCLEAEGTV